MGGRGMEMISDEIREFVRRSYADEHMDPRELIALADRVDTEMVELPKDADGVTIHVGDTVYTADGSEAYVARIDFVPDVPGAELRFPCGTISEYVPRYIYHERPDSWGRIAEELDKWCNSVDVDGDACEKPRELAERIRKLAKERGDA